jgi:ribonucleoside-triphosphate reductase
MRDKMSENKSGHSIDTQILTPIGIKNLIDIKIGNKVYGVDKHFNLKETSINKIIKSKYNGKMIGFKNNNCYDFLVTFNQPMFFRKHWKNEFERVPANELFKNYGHIPSVFNWKGKEKKKFYLKEKSYNTNDILQLIAWYISEGNIVRNRGKPTSFQIRNQKHKREIKKLLKKMDIKYGLYDKSKFIVNEPQIAEYLRINCNEYAINKTIPDEILLLSKKQLKIFFDTLMKGDGYQGNGQNRFYTISFNLVHKFILLCLKLGYHANYKNRGIRNGGEIRGRKVKGKYDSFEVGIQKEAKGFYSPYKDKSYYGHKNIKTINYHNTVWNLKTDTGNFFIIRNGKVSLSPN